MSYGSNHPGLRHAKPRPRVLDKRAKQAAADRAVQDMRSLVKARDRGRCRVCSKPGNQVHHLIYRSRGGKHHPNNGVWVCNQCQQDIHAKLIVVAWVGDNPASTVRFQRLRWEKVSRTLSRENSWLE
jgi:5-methylcytosine-specific restriction endonuclease McrA